MYKNVVVRKKSHSHYDLLEMIQNMQLQLQSGSKERSMTEMGHRIMQIIMNLPPTISGRLSHGLRVRMPEEKTDRSTSSIDAD
jgi:hypothetical protein